MEKKLPNSKEAFISMARTMHGELSDDILDTITGGNDDVKDKFNPPIDWTCPGCGAIISCKQMQDATKHMTKCPGNPYK